MPEPHADPTWTLAIDGVDPRLERVHERLLTLADGRVGTSGTPLALHPSASPGRPRRRHLRRTGPRDLAPDVPGVDAALPVDRRGRPDRARARHAVGAAPRGDADIPGDGALGQVLEPGATRSRRPSDADGIARPSSRCRHRPSPPGLAGEQGRLDGIPWARLETAEGGVTTAVGDARTPRRRLPRVRAVRRLRARREPTAATHARRTRASRTRPRRASSGCSREHRAAWARAVGERRRRHRGRRELQRAIRLALFHLMALGRGRGRGGGRRARTVRARRTAVTCSGTATSSCCRSSPPRTRRRRARCSSTGSGGCRRRATIAQRPRARGAPGSRGSRRARGFDVTPQTGRDRVGDDRPDPHRADRGAHRRRRRVGGVVLRGLDRRRRRSLEGPGFELLRRDRPLLGVAGPVGPRRRRAHLRRDRPRRVPRDRRRQRVHERDGALEPASRPPPLADGDERVPEFERLRWLETADALVDGYDPAHELYEQFAGFYELEPLVIAELAARAPDRGRPAARPRRRPPRPGPEAGRRADAPPPRPRRGRAGLAPPEPRLLRAAHRARQLAVARDPRVAVRACGPARRGRSRALDIAARIDLDDLTGTHGGRPAPGDDGGRLAGARLRVRGRAAEGGRPRARPASCPTPGGRWRSACGSAAPVCACA